MARNIWSGALSFGLINIPVALMSPIEEERIRFNLLDKSDHAPVGYKQYNKATGKEISRKNIVKGYEYEPNQFVIVTDEDFKKANPKATQTIDIEEFVDLEDLDVLLFERPYYLVPGKNGEKGYLLLRKVLEVSQKVAVATFVLRQKQHLVAIMARGDYLILEILRFPREVLGVDEADFLSDYDFRKVKISERELKMAQNLVEDMTASWEPDKFKDTYQEDLMKRIKQKIKRGDVETSPEIDEDLQVSNTNVVDLMPLLEKSLTGKTKAKSKRSSKAEGKKKAGSARE